MASWFRKRKKKAPEPIALVGLECGVDDAGDDEERVPLKTFSHRMGPDSPWEQYPAHQCLVIEEAMRAKPSGGSVRLSEHLPFEVRWGTKATSSRLRCTVWKSTRVSGASWPRWLRRAERNRHRHAIEQVSRRWRG